MPERPKTYGALLTLSECARRLNVTRRIIQGLVDGGKLAYVRVGTSDRRVPEGVLETWIGSNLVHEKRRKPS
jgi:excisionase family DNA binding protein